MKLIPIAERDDAAQILWDLLAERTTEQSISHKAMPTWEEHLDFIEDHAPALPEDMDYSSKNYRAWYLIQARSSDDLGLVPTIIGAIYLTRGNEIGVSIHRDSHRHGYGSMAVRLLMEKHGSCYGRYLANVNPANTASIRMWEKLGFKLIQQTYELCV